MLQIYKEIKKEIDTYMCRNHFGVLTKTSKGYILYNHKCEINISKELEYLWKLDIPVHIKIESDNRRLLDENNCPIYYDRDMNKKYKFHINDINIEQILESSIGKQLDIMVVYEREDIKYEQRCVYSS